MRQRLNLKEEGSTVSVNSKIEKFSAEDLIHLRSNLLRSGIDSWQAAEVVSDFLAGRGYGVSAQRARDSISRLKKPDWNLECMQEELENLACVM